MEALLLLSFFVASVSWTISKSTLFEPIRKYFYKDGSFLSKLVLCPYCVSHYVSAFTTHLAIHLGYIDSVYFYGFVDWIFFTIVIVWMAAFQHAIIDILTRRVK